MLNLKHLEHIDAVVRTGSLTAASDELGISPPALSKSIRSLESQLGTPLFDRKGRVLSLTRFGQEFTDEARRMLSHADYLEARARAVARGEAGEVRIGAGPMAQQALLPVAIADLAQSHPQLRVDVTEATFPELVQGLLDFHYDFIVADPDDLTGHPDRDRLTIEPLVSMPLPIFCRTGHPLLDGDDITMADVLAQRWVSPRIPDHYKRRIGSIAKKSGMSASQVKRRIEQIPDIRIEDLRSCLEIAVATDLLTASLMFVARPFIDDGRAVRPPVPFGFLTRTAVMSHAQRALPPAARALMDGLQAASARI